MNETVPHNQNSAVESTKKGLEKSSNPLPIRLVCLLFVSAIR